MLHVSAFLQICYQSPFSSRLEYLKFSEYPVIFLRHQRDYFSGHMFRSRDSLAGDWPELSYLIILIWDAALARLGFKNQITEKQTAFKL
jgi:hypothetical protein